MIRASSFCASCELSCVFGEEGWKVIDQDSNTSLPSGMGVGEQVYGCAGCPTTPEKAEANHGVAQALIEDAALVAIPPTPPPPASPAPLCSPPPPLVRAFG